MSLSQKFRGLSSCVVLALGFAAGLRASEAKLEETFAGIVKGLDSAEFDKREAAEKELRALGASALPLIRKKLKEVIEAEVRLRLVRTGNTLVWDELRVQLNRPLDFEIDVASAKEAFTEFAAKAKIPIELAPDADVQFDRIHFNARGLPARDALRGLTHACGLEFGIKATRLQVSRSKNSDSLTVIYRAENLPEVEQFVGRLNLPETADVSFSRDEKGNAGQFTVTGMIAEQLKFGEIFATLCSPFKAGELSPEPLWKKGMRAQLRTKVSLNLDAQPLSAAIKAALKNTKIPFWIDPVIDQMQLVPVTFKAQSMELSSAVQWIAKLAGAQIRFDDGILIVYAWKEGAQTNPNVFRAYDLGELTKAYDDFPAPTAASISDMIRQRIRPESWDAALGTSIEDWNGKLFVCQSREIHDLISELLYSSAEAGKAIRKAEAERKKLGSRKPLDPAQVPEINWSRPKSEPESWRAELEARLQKKISFEFTERSFREVLAWFAEHTDATLVLDPMLVAQGADNTPITLKVSDMSAELALKWLAKLVDVDIKLVDSAVFVTKRGNFDENVELRMYYVHDFTELNVAEITTLIHDRLLPVEFADPCTSIAEQNGALVVMAHPETHARISKLLTLLRKHYDDKEIHLPNSAEFARDEALNEKFHNPLSVEFKALPLEQAAARLQEMLESPVKIDEALLAKKGPEITFAVEKGDALAVLHGIFDPLPLEFEWKENALHIRESADNDVTVSMYQVADLIDREGSAIAIANQIRNTIVPAKWDAALGTSIEVMGGRLLVVQSREMHAQIKKFVDNLREQHGKEKK